MEKQLATAPRYINRAEAALQVGCSVRHLERLAQTGEGPPFVRHGVRKIVYEVHALAEWMRGRTVNVTGATAPAQAA